MSKSLVMNHSQPFFDESAQAIWDHFGHEPCTWRQTLILVPNIRSSLTLRSSMIRLLPHPTFCPRTLSFKNVPAHMGLQSPTNPMSPSEQTAILFNLLPEAPPLQQLEQAKSWQRQMDELARNANKTLNEDAFTRLLRPLWPGQWSDELFRLYQSSAPMQLRQQTLSLWEAWEIKPPTFPVVVIGSTGSTFVSGGWIKWAQSYEKGLVIQRGNFKETVQPHIVQHTQNYTAAKWISQQIEASLSKGDKPLTVVSALPFDELYQQLIARGIDVDKGEYAHFRSTPTGQFWACLIKLIAEPSNLLLWECLKRTTTEQPHLQAGEMLCRQEKSLMSDPHISLWEHIQRRPNFASLTFWWAYIRDFVQQLNNTHPNLLLSDILSWPTELGIRDISQLHATLLPHIDMWWPIPQYRFEREVKPKVQWVGPWEARSLNSERIWVCGLSEGVWPGSPPIESILPHHERDKLGLPDTSHFDKLSHHDLLCTLGAATHVTWVTSEDKVPSRWIAGLSVQKIVSPHYPTTENTPIPVGLKHKPIEKISVTEAERLMRDPYAYYIKSILRLSQLDPIQDNRNPTRTSRDKGILFHRIMQLIVQKSHSQWQSLLDEESAIDFFWLSQIQACLPHLTWDANALCETLYTLQVDNIKLTGRLDRIDLEPFVVVNYKTGSLPTVEAVEKGWAPQIILETILASRYHKKDSGVSMLLTLKHTPEARLWKWSKEDIQNATQAFSQWINGINSFPALGGIGMEHIERSSMWMI